MSAEIAATIIASITAIIVAIIAAIEASRRYSASRERFILNKIEQMDKRLVTLGLKADTLWEIYGEEVIRNARNSGMIASQSRQAPTADWVDLVSAVLVEKIELQASESSQLLHSPYDVFVEVWQCYKEDLIAVSRCNNVSMDVLSGGVLTICENAVNNAINSRTY